MLDSQRRANRWERWPGWESVVLVVVVEGLVVRMVVVWVYNEALR